MSMDTSYFQQIIDEETLQAERLAEVIQQLYQPTSVTDFGCATGLYLEPYAAKGIAVHGYDNSAPALALTRLPDSVHLADLTMPTKVAKSDVSICLEVLEHIDAENAVKVAKTIAKNSNILVFSAAHPGQGGDGHINCRPKDYWQGVFHAYGMRYDATASERIIAHMQSGYHMGWLPLNLMVLVKS